MPSARRRWSRRGRNPRGGCPLGRASPPPSPRSRCARARPSAAVRTGRRRHRCSGRTSSIAASVLKTRGCTLRARSCVDQVDRIAGLLRDVEGPLADHREAVQKGGHWKNGRRLSVGQPASSSCARIQDRVILGEACDDGERHFSDEPVVGEVLREHTLMLHDGIRVGVHRWQLRPVSLPLVGEEHRAPDADPVRLQVVWQIAGERERMRLHPCVIRHTPEVQLPAVHAIEHGTERTHGPDTRCRWRE